ncbi:MAG: helix-turn-helix domain-containing protein [Pseudonocardiaceae bacterium]
MSTDWTTLRPWSELTPATLELIANGDDSQEGHRVAYRVALGMRNAGRAYGEYEQVMTNRDNGCARWYTEYRDGRPPRNGEKRKNGRGQKAAQRELQRAWSATLKAPAPRNPDTDAAALWDHCLAARRVAARRIPDRRRHTRLRVLDALSRLATYHGVTVAASKYQLAELSQISASTVVTALDELCSPEVGVLHRHRADRRPGEATIYTIVNPAAGSGGVSPADHSNSTAAHSGVSSLDHSRHSLQGGEALEWTNGEIPAPTHAPAVEWTNGEIALAHAPPASSVSLPIWRHRDIGERGRILYGMLSPLTELTTGQLITHSGIPRSTAYRKLSELERRGLAVRTPNGWLRGPADPAAVASPDAQQASENAHHRYQHQRYGWQEWLLKRNPEWLPRSGVLAQPIQPMETTRLPAEGESAMQIQSTQLGCTGCLVCGHRLPFGVEHLKVHPLCDPAGHYFGSETERIAA